MDDTFVKWLAMCERKILRIIFELVYENDLGWRLRQNEELCELSDVPVVVKYYVQKITVGQAYSSSG
jgi:hypothetical protein